MLPMEKNILAIDLGKGSIGLALSRSGMFVTPLKEVRFPATHYEFAIQGIKDVMELERIESFVIGYPLFPSGDPCEMTPIVEDFILRLNEVFPAIPVHKQDERNSTVDAASLLHQQGKNAKKQRQNIDSAAAAVILSRYLKSIGQMED
jgi:putative Holliday junction resolvase